MRMCVCVCEWVCVCVCMCMRMCACRCSLRVCVRASLLVCMFARRIVSYCIYFRGDMRANDKGYCDTHNNVIVDIWWLQQDCDGGVYFLHVFCPVFAVSSKVIRDDGPSLAMTHIWCHNACFHCSAHLTSWGILSYLPMVQNPWINPWVQILLEEDRAMGRAILF